MGRDVSHLPLLGAGRLGEGVQRDLEEEASGLTKRKTCSRVLIGRLHVKAHEGHRSELQTKASQADFLPPLELCTHCQCPELK